MLNTDFLNNNLLDMEIKYCDTFRIKVALGWF